MLCNLREYDVIQGTTNKQGLFQNYPYNDLGKDAFLQSNQPNIGAFGQCTHNRYSGYRKDAFSFHSPDTNFKDPYLSAKEVVIYGEQYGIGETFFQFPDKHPRHKLITNGTFLIAAVIGLAYPITQNLGKRSFHRTKKG